MAAKVDRLMAVVSVMSINDVSSAMGSAGLFQNITAPITVIKTSGRTNPTITDSAGSMLA
jgi:hypothetical protein